MKTKKVQNFLFNWNRVDENCEKIYESLVENNINCVVINSSDKKRDSWINLGDDYWTYGQTYEAFKRFQAEDFDYINIIFGDIYPHGYINADNIKKLIERTEQVLQENENIGVYSPEYSGKAYWTINRTSIKDDIYKDNFLVAATISDYWYLAIHRDIAKIFNEFLQTIKDKYSDFHLWQGTYGMGTILCIISHLQKKVICRDRQIVLHHDDFTGWNQNNEFDRQFALLLNEFGIFSNKEKETRIIRKKILERANTQNPILLKELWL